MAKLLRDDLDQFWIWAEVNGLTREDVYRELGVTRAKDFTGTTKDAIQLLKPTVNRIQILKEHNRGYQ